MASFSKKPSQSQPFQSQPLNPPNTANPAKKKGCDYINPDEEEEIRKYCFSALALRIERNLLKEQGVDDIHGLLCRAADSIAAFNILVKNLDQDAKIEGAMLHLVAEELQRVYDLVFDIQELFSAVDPVETS